MTNAHNEQTNKTTRYNKQNKATQIKQTGTHIHKHIHKIGKEIERT